MRKHGSLLLVALGSLVTLLAGRTALSSFQTLREGALPTTVAGAPAERWVVLQDAAVRCETRRTTGRATYFEAAARDGGERFLVQVRGDATCEGLVLQGGFSADRLSAEQVRERLGIEPGSPDPVRVFSLLDAAFMRNATIFSLAFLGLGLLTLAIGTRRWLRATAKLRP